MDTPRVVAVIKMLSLVMIAVTFLIHLDSMNLPNALALLLVCFPFIFLCLSPNNKKVINVHLHLLRLLVLLMALGYGLSHVGDIFSGPMHIWALTLTQAFIVGVIELPLYLFLKDAPSS